jgi:release factor glutamine methyltransferase
VTSAEPRLDEGPPSRTIRRSILDAADFLRTAGVAEPRLDAEVLLAHALGMDRVQLHMETAHRLTGADEKCYAALLDRRAAREPVAYITRHKEFWSLDFAVTPDVLIPRPETELLVEIALATLANPADPRSLRILDLCTGSGAVAVSLAKELGGAAVWATDICGEALAVAARNSERHRVSDRIQLVRSDLFKALGPLNLKFDLIVCNPPYIRTGDLPQLIPEVTLWEPKLALDGGPDGLSVYRRLAAEAAAYLERGGQLLLEIGADMGRSVAELFETSADYANVKVYQDYAGHDRVVAVSRTRQDS